MKRYIKAITIWLDEETYSNLELVESRSKKKKSALAREAIEIIFRSSEVRK